MSVEFFGRVTWYYLTRSVWQDVLITIRQIVMIVFEILRESIFFQLVLRSKNSIIFSISQFVALWQKRETKRETETERIKRDSRTDGFSHVNIDFKGYDYWDAFDRHTHTSPGIKMSISYPPSITRWINDIRVNHESEKTNPLNRSRKIDLVNLIEKCRVEDFATYSWSDRTYVLQIIFFVLRDDDVNQKSISFTNQNLRSEL